MRIYYDDPTVRYVRIDREALTTFLREQGVSEEKIKQLVIRIRPRVPKSYASEACRENTTLGASLKNTVVVCTWQHPKNAHKLNSTLLHELYHFATKGKYGSDNYAIEYWKRPSEIAARKFAETHQHRLLLSLEGIPQVIAVPTQGPAPIDCPVSITSRQTTIAPIAVIALTLYGLVKLLSWLGKETQHG